jgi:uncharacterized membrane protein YeaQ/YmgE (transglycosylase-associated protein family)
VRIEVGTGAATPSPIQPGKKPHGFVICFPVGTMVEEGRYSWQPTQYGDGNMTLLLILLVGGIIGWLASILMRTDAQQGVFLNIVVGIVGAVIAGFIITPLIGGAPITSGAFDILSLFASFLGAVVLLAIVNLFRRGSVR